MGHELDLALPFPGPQAAVHSPELAFEFCLLYFKAIPDEKFCMKTKFSAPGTESWCYVPKDCEQGQELQHDIMYHMEVKVKSKICDPASEKVLHTMKFEDFAVYQKSMKLEMGLMVQFAYPKWAGDEKIFDVMEFWGLTSTDKDVKPLSRELRTKLQSVVDSGVTTFIGSRDGHPPYGVVEGKKLYWINFSEANKKRSNDEKWTHKEEMNAWACVAGCDKVSPIW